MFLKSRRLTEMKTCNNLTLAESTDNKLKVRYLMVTRISELWVFLGLRTNLKSNQNSAVAEAEAEVGAEEEAVIL